jgi:hypothetical protein
MASNFETMNLLERSSDNENANLRTVSAVQMFVKDLNEFLMISPDFGFLMSLSKNGRDRAQQYIG